MNKTELSRRIEQTRRLGALGFSQGEAETLRRISLTLHRWDEHACNGEVETDPDGKTYSVHQGGLFDRYKIVRYPTPNRKAGAIRRLGLMMADHPGWDFYHQGDPRGAALYLYRPSDLMPGQSVDSYYSTVGVCIY